DLHIGPYVDQQRKTGTHDGERVDEDDAQLPAGGRRGCLGGWSPAHRVVSGRTRVPPTIRCGIGVGWPRTRDIGRSARTPEAYRSSIKPSEAAFEMAWTRLLTASFR